MEPEIIIILLLAIYILPSIIVIIRNHQSSTSIILLDLLLGWTLVGWVFALVWSFTNPAQVIVNNQTAQSTADELHKFAILKEQGLLTDEEFNKKKSELLIA